MKVGMKMKKIAIFNNKGGVSKTTTVVNVAYVMAYKLAKKVLIIDCDGQQNATRFLANNVNDIGIEETLINDSVYPDSSFSKTRYDNIDILTSTVHMNECAENFSALNDDVQKTNINKFTSYLKKIENDYDYVLFDMPPALNSVTEKIISISDGVIVPVELGIFAIQGIAKVTDAINKVNAEFIGCFIAKYDKNNKSDAELKEILERSLGDKVFKTVIPYSNIIRNSLNYKVTANEYMYWQSPAKKFIELTEEIIRKVG